MHYVESLVSSFCIEMRACSAASGYDLTLSRVKNGSFVQIAHTICVRSIKFQDRHEAVLPQIKI